MKEFSEIDLERLQQRTYRRVKDLAEKLGVTPRKLNYQLDNGKDRDLLKRLASLLVEERKATVESAKSAVARERLDLEPFLV